VEGNGRHTRVKAPSHRVAGLAVNCPLPGPPGLRSNLGGEPVSTRGSSLAVLCVQCEDSRVLKYEHNTAELVSARGGSLAVLCVHNTAELVSSSLFIQCVHCIT
jgi:hypothetical protein